MADEPRIVSAVGVSANATFSGDWDLAARQESAMSQAVAKAYSEGVTDPVEVKKLMMAAYEAVSNEG